MANYIDSRKRKQELQYQIENDQQLLDYYQQEQYNYPSTSNNTNLLDTYLYNNNDYQQQEKRYDEDSDRKRSLHLEDLDQKNHQKELIQAWSMSGNTGNQSGTITPGFFSPGFLDSLPQDTKSLEFPFPSTHHDFILNQLIPETTTNDLNSSVSNPNSTSSSPMINVSGVSQILTTSSISSTTSSRSSPPYEDIMTLQEPPQRKPPMEESKLQPIIKNYLANQYTDQERTVILLTSKVAQKSYGTEKRFLCPPPTTILLGTNWWTPSYSNEPSQETLNLGDGSPSLHPPKLTVSISGGIAVQSGQVEWYTVSGATVGLTGHKIQASEPTHPSRFRSSADTKSTMERYNNQAHELLSAGKCVSKHLFINDADEKRKRVETLVKIQMANGVQLGPFPSKAIKVISKPSKKRQSVKNLDLCIHHGTTVSLFNRIRSQTVSTKYLGVSSSHPGKPSIEEESTCFVARTTSWDPFIIWIVDPHQQPSTNSSNNYYPPPPAIALKTNQLIPIHYNQHIVLQCLTTGLVSPVMTIRKIDRASMAVGGDDEVFGDPVSQLHKIALQIVQGTYLACLNDMVGIHKTSEPRHRVLSEGGKVVRKRRVSNDSACWQEDVSDAAVWTIVGTESQTYSFYQPSGALPSVFPALLQVTKKSDRLLQLHGENLTRDLQVWIGETKMKTEYKSRELIVCQVPAVSSSSLPILFVKGDGTICKTGKFYPSVNNM